MWKTRLNNWINKKKEQMQKGIVVTRQMHDEKERKKFEKAKLAPIGSLRYGLHHQQTISEFMKDAYEVRKQRREEKYGRHDE